MRVILCASLAVLAGLPIAIRAHHSPTMFDLATRVTLSGTVRKFQWNNPHCYIQLLVTDAKGKQVEWNVEAGAPMYLQQAGWKPSTLKQGDQVTVIISPLRHQGASKGGLLLEARGADGKPLGKGAVKTP